MNLWSIASGSKPRSSPMGAPSKPGTSCSATAPPPASSRADARFPHRLDEDSKMVSSTRRAVLLGAASLSVAALGVRRAHAAEYTYKIGTDLPVSHPLHIPAPAA